MVDYVSPDSASCGRKYSLATGGYDGLRRLQCLAIVHAVLESWNRLVVYYVVRRAAIQKPWWSCQRWDENSFRRCLSPVS